MWHYMTVTCNWLPDCDSMTFLWNYYAITMLFIAWNSLPSVGPSTSTSLEAPFFEVLKHQQMVIEPHPFRKRWSYMVIYGNIWWYLTFSHIISLEISTYSCNFGVLWPVPSRSSSHGTPRSVWISMDTPVFVVFFPPFFPCLQFKPTAAMLAWQSNNSLSMVRSEIPWLIRQFEARWMLEAANVLHGLTDWLTSVDATCFRKKRKP